MSVLTLNILILAALLIFNGLLSASEMAIVSSRKARIQKLAAGGNHKALIVLELLESPTRFLSTVQIGITMVGIMSGAFGEATIARSLENLLNKNEFLLPYSHILSVAIVILFITYFSLLCELVPKRFALENPEKVAIFTASPMKIISKITFPVVKFLSYSTEGLVKVFGMNSNKDEPPVTQEELITLIEMGTKAGTFEKSEQAMMERVLGLGVRNVSSIMTTRPEIVWIDILEKNEKNLEKIACSKHSYFPVARGSLDNVLGVIHVKDIFAQTAQDIESSLESKLRQPLFFPRGTEGLRVLEKFREKGVHIGLVLDEYGTVQGLVTLSDILEAIVGNLESVEQGDLQQVVIRDDGSWLLDGVMPIEDFKTLFDVDGLPGEDRGKYQTVAGFVMAQLGRIPKEGDKIQWRGLVLEVVDMDGNRVDKVLVAKTP